MCAITVSSIGMLIGIYGVKSDDYHKNPEISTHQEYKSVPLKNVAENVEPQAEGMSKYDSQLEMIHDMMKKHPHDKGLKDMEQQIETIKAAAEYTNLH